MERTRDLVVASAAFRSSYIPTLIETGGFYVPQDQAKTDETIKRAADRVSRIEVRGIENLVEAQQLARKYRLTVTGNHTNEWDTVVTKIALRNVGQKEFGDRLTYYGGLQIYEREELRMMVGTDNLLYVVSPSDMAEIDEAKAEAEEIGDIEALFVLATCDGYQRALNNATKEKSKTLFVPGSQSNICAFYPETEYQRQGGITRAPANVSALFSRRERQEYILPVMVFGHEEIEGGGKIDLTVLFGKPYDSVLAWRNRPEGFHAVDLIMGSVASLYPERINPR